jgi:hypothetical protein
MATVWDRCPSGLTATGDRYTFNWWANAAPALP